MTRSFIIYETKILSIENFFVFNGHLYSSASDNSKGSFFPRSSLMRRFISSATSCLDKLSVVNVCGKEWVNKRKNGVSVLLCFALEHWLDVVLLDSRLNRPWDQVFWVLVENSELIELRRSSYFILL